MSYLKKYDRFFNSLSHVVHPRTQLCANVITIQECGYYIIGCPQSLVGEKYKRNGFFFNLCFVIQPVSDEPISEDSFYSEIFNQASFLRPLAQNAYESIVLKVNNYITECETDFNVFGDGSEYGFIEPFIIDLFHSLKNKGSCKISLNDVFNLNLQFLLKPDYFSEAIDFDLFSNDFIKQDKKPHLHKINPIRDVTDDQAFILVQHDTFLNGEYNPYSALDLTSSMLISHVNGHNTLYEISQAAKVDVNVTRICLLNLLRLGVVRAISSSISFWVICRKLVNGTPTRNFAYLHGGYMALPKLKYFLSDESLFSTCLQSCLLNITSLKEEDSQTSARYILFQIILALTELQGSYFLDKLVTLAIKLRCQLIVFSPPNVPENEILQLCKFSENHLNSSNVLFYIDLIYLIQFAELNGLIKKISCHPISDKVSLDRINDRCFSLRKFSTLTEPRRNVNRKVRLSKKMPTIDCTNLNEKSLTFLHNNQNIWTLLRAFRADGLSSLDEILAFSSVYSNDSVIDNLYFTTHCSSVIRPGSQFWINYGSVPPMINQLQTQKPISSLVNSKETVKTIAEQLKKSIKYFSELSENDSFEVQTKNDKPVYYLMALQILNKFLKRLKIENRREASQLGLLDEENMENLIDGDLILPELRRTILNWLKEKNISADINQSFKDFLYVEDYLSVPTLYLLWR